MNYLLSALLGALAGAAITLAIEAMWWPRLPDVDALFPMKHEAAAFYHMCLAETPGAVAGCTALARAVEREVLARRHQKPHM